MWCYQFKGGDTYEYREKLYALRTKKGVTQLELAKIVEVSDKTISALEAMKRTPKVGSIRKICNHYGLELETFIDESTDNLGDAKEQPTVSDGLAEAQQGLIAYAKTLTEEQAVLTNQRVVIYYNCIGAFDVPDRRKIRSADIIMETRKGVALSYALEEIAV